MNISDSKTFCPAPWTSIRVGHSGSIGICSFSNDVGDSNTSGVEDILTTGSTISEIKKCISNNEWHRNCEFCQNAEENGGQSERLLYLKFLKDETKNKINQDPLANHLTNASMNLSNLCNLSCNYCNPDASTEWKRIKGIPIKLDRMEDSGLSFLLKNAETLEWMMVGGGEPLLQKGVHQLLNELSTHHQVSVIITTNLSVDLEKNKIFKAIIDNPMIVAKWMISFDGLGEKFEYVRHGADWAQFEKNIQILKKYKQNIDAHPAYSMYSAFDLVEFHDYCDVQGINVFWCSLASPYQLDVRYAPDAIRQLAIENLDAVLTKYHGRTNVSLHELSEYRKMVSNGVTWGESLDNYSSDESVRSTRMLQFHNDIEKLMPKNKTFEQLWPDIHSMLIDLSSK